MSVNDGEKVNAQVTNGAFVSKEVDDTKIGLLNLQDPSSANVDDVQGEINTNKTDIADHEGRITQNESDIVDHETRIGTNETEIQAIEDSVGAASGITPLDAGVKIPLIYIPDSLIGAMNYQGTWNATTNTPTLADGGVGGDKGHYYVVQVAGSTSIDGVTDWEIGDWIISNGTIWEKIDNTDKVSSFNSRTGAVLPVASDYDADQVDFDNVASGMTATDVQAAIDENDTRLDSIEGSSYVNSFNTRTGAVSPAASDYDSNQVDYDNATSGLAATDAQGAIDEVEGRVDTLEGATHVNSFNSRTGVVLPAASDYDAIQVDYDDSVTAIGETDVQGAIVNHEGRIDTLEGAGSGVTSFNTRTGAVVSVSGDYAANEITETTIKKFDIKHNRNSSVAPVITDDSASEYQVGSHWFDKVAQVEYVCQDNSVGAAVWIIASGSGGVGSPSIFGLFNAEETSPLDDWTTSAGVLSEETTNQLNGDTSYKYIPTAVSDETESPIVVIPLRSKRKKTVMTEFVFEANEDGFRIEVRDNTNKVLGFTDVEASQDSARIIYNLTGSEISLNFAIVTAIYTASMQIVVDDIIFDDEVFRKIETVYTNSVGLEGNDGRTITANTEDISWNGTGVGWTGGADGQPSYYTVQRNDSIISIDAGRYTTVDTDDIIDLYVNGISVPKPLNNPSPTGRTQIARFGYISHKGEFNAGDKISFRGAISRTLNTLISSRHFLNINETATGENVAVDGENEILEEYFAHTLAGSFASINTKIPYYTTETTNTTGSLVTVSNSSTLGMSITANRDCRLYLIAPSHWAGSGESFGISKNSTELTTNVQNITTNTDIVALSTGTRHTVNAEIQLNAGDVIRPHAGNIYGTTNTVANWNFRFHAVDIKQNIIIPIADPYENTYSAHIQGSANTNNLDIVTVLSSSSDFIKEVVHDSLTASWLVKWKVGHFTVPPSVLGTVEMNIAAYGRILVVDYVNTTEARILISNSGTAEDNDFHLMVQRQGADYKEPQGIFIGQSVPIRTAYVKEVQAVNVAGATTLVTATYTKAVLNTITGDSGFISIASSVITLRAGTYDFSASIPTYVNSGLNTVSLIKARLRDITNTATVGVSNTVSSRGSGTTAGHIAGHNLDMSGRITITAATNYELQVWVNTTTNVAPALGRAANATEEEVYTQVKITKVK